MHLRLIKYTLGFAILFFCACTNGGGSGNNKVIKGIYSFGPDAKSFKDCDTGREYWVTDQSNKLELQYSQMNIEKPYVPVYIEIEGEKVKSGKEGMGSEYDSTLIVKKLIKITKEIPQDMCN
ncbi:hypothetical protein [Mucilaginibacter sp. KACC 22063]|uniref:hypothetical protein n=1 Tax=Mucilaginibacter sp. KACC 22063 TaxID=3025666 RepID=UPI0023654E76|nr:hypothetical protein [Mucilaginibacter sp. KACC 22063]WDF55321.1 hypothetical protein PQ461_20525 [Mucilaginibacter sp. KACC 22063]